MTGNRYGRLLVIRRDGSNHRGEKLWLCNCDCGKAITLPGYPLRSGHTSSCGCGEHEIKTPLDHRFWSKVSTRGDDDCWPWEGAPNNKGYGQFSIPSGLGGKLRTRFVLSHRMAFKLWYGRDPTENLLHTCDTPLCCNPTHLIEGTQKQNLEDMRKKNRDAHGERHPQSKLTDAQVEEIRVCGDSAAELSSRYGVSLTLIRLIRRNKRRMRDGKYSK